MRAVRTVRIVRPISAAISVQTLPIIGLTSPLTACAPGRLDPVYGIQCTSKKYDVTTLNYDIVLQKDHIRTGLLACRMAETSRAELTPMLSRDNPSTAMSFLFC